MRLYFAGRVVLCVGAMFWYIYISMQFIFISVFAKMQKKVIPIQYLFMFFLHITPMLYIYCTGSYGCGDPNIYVLLYVLSDCFNLI